MEHGQARSFDRLVGKTVALNYVLTLDIVVSACGECEK